MTETFLPKSWVEKKLGDVCTLQRGFDLPQRLRESGKYPLISSSGEIDSHNDFKVKAPGVVTGRSGSIGNVFYIEEDFWPLNTVLYVKDFHANDERFVYYLLRKFDLSKFASGAGVPTLNRNHVHDEIVQIPESIEEQKRIVAILDEAFAGISQAVANAEKNLANARELFDSYLNGALEPVAVESPCQTLTDLAELIVDCEHKTAPTQETGYPSIRTPNIGKGDLLLDGVYRVSEATYKIWTRRAVPQSGDLILAREAPAGNVGVIPENEKVCLGQRTVLIRPQNSLVDSEYLAYLMLHPVMQKRLLSGSTGATVQHVNVKDIRQLQFGKLPQIQTQKDVVTVLKTAKSQSKRLEDIYQRKLVALAELKQAILQKAFTGELTAQKSPLDVCGVSLGVQRDELVVVVRDGRERHS